MQILPHVYLINGFPYGRHQNSYLLDLGGTLVMVDSGDLETPAYEAVERHARIWGFDLSQVSTMLVTHAHYDHSSHAARLQRLGARIVANQDCADAMASGDDRCIGYAVHQVFEPCRVDQVVRDGEELVIGGVPIRCIEAPGHANSCTVYDVLLDAHHLWFVGDVLLVGPQCESVELGWGGGPDYHRPTYLETLRKLAHMPCDTLFPGHGPAGIGQGKKLLEMGFTKALVEWRRPAV